VGTPKRRWGVMTRFRMLPSGAQRIFPGSRIMVGCARLLQPTYPDSLLGAPSTPACAAFNKGGQLQLVSAVNRPRKSGGTRGTRPSALRHPGCVSATAVWGGRRKGCRGGCRGGEGIPDTTVRLYQFLRVIAIYLAAQSADVYVHHVGQTLK